ncbi:hypothetical protein [Nonomuraea sp. NPDC049129]|uniref:hypothetical protein n=1 Tax=Nonomuraea sp. NPDC049129 TaxID=3155272 RepID=UPI00340A3330
MEAEKLGPGTWITLWSSLWGSNDVKVREIDVREKDGEVRIKSEEVEWAWLVVPIGTEVDLA